MLGELARKQKRRPKKLAGTLTQRCETNSCWNTLQKPCGKPSRDMAIDTLSHPTVSWTILPKNSVMMKLAGPSKPHVINRDEWSGQVAQLPAVLECELP